MLENMRKDGGLICGAETLGKLRAGGKLSRADIREDTLRDHYVVEVMLGSATVGEYGVFVTRNFESLSFLTQTNDGDTVVPPLIERSSDASTHSEMWKRKRNRNACCMYAYRM